MKKNKRRVYDVLLGLCILVFVVSGGTLGYKIVAQRKNDGRLEALSEILEEQAVAEAGTEGDKAAVRGKERGGVFKEGGSGALGRGQGRRAA